MLGAVRDRILTPENIGEAVEMALGIVRRSLAADDDGGEDDRKRLAQIGLEIENAARLAARVGDVEGVARVVESLEAERRDLADRLAARRPRVSIGFG